MAIATKRNPNPVSLITLKERYSVVPQSMVRDIALQCAYFYDFTVCLIWSCTRVGLTWNLRVPLSCQPLLPNSHQSRQNQADSGTLKFQVNPTQVHDQMRHPVQVSSVQLWYISRRNAHFCNHLHKVGATLPCEFGHHQIRGMIAHSDTYVASIQACWLKC